MSGVVVVSGNPRTGSRTSTLAAAVGTALGGTSEVIEVGALGAGLLDRLPANALAGKKAVPVTVAGVAPQASAAAALLAQLLGELGATVLPALPVVESDLGDAETIAAEYVATT